MSDLIDREQAKDAIDKYLVGRNLVTDGTMMARLINEIVIDRLPSAQPEPSQVARDIARIVENEKDMRILPKRGKWIKTARWGRVYYCNQCRNYLDFDGVNAGRGSTNFCPNCGADMRGEQDG